MTQTYKVQVSMNQAHIVESGFVWKQGDFGFNIEIEVLDFDTTGATPQIIFRKSTGAVEATQITRAGNKFTYAIRGTELDTPGPCVCDLKLNDSTTKRVSTASFKYFVIPDTMDGLEQEASSYSDTISQLTTGLMGVISGAVKAPVKGFADITTFETGFISTVDGKRSYREDSMVSPLFAIGTDGIIHVYRNASTVPLGSVWSNCHYYDADLNYLGSQTSGVQQKSTSYFARPSIQYPTAFYVAFTVLFTNIEDKQNINLLYSFFIRSSEIYNNIKDTNEYNIVDINPVWGGINNGGAYDAGNNQRIRTQEIIDYPKGSIIRLLKNVPGYQVNLNIYYKNGRFIEFYDEPWHDMDFLNSVDLSNYTDDIAISMSFKYENNFTMDETNLIDLNNIIKVLRPITTEDSIKEERLTGEITGDKNIFPEMNKTIDNFNSPWYNTGNHFELKAEDTSVWSYENRMTSIKLPAGNYKFIVHFIENKGTGSSAVAYNVRSESQEYLAYNARYPENYDIVREFTLEAETTVGIQFKSYKGNVFDAYLYKDSIKTLKNLSEDVDHIETVMDLKDGYADIYTIPINETKIKMAQKAEAGRLLYGFLTDNHLNSGYTQQNIAQKHQLKAMIDTAVGTGVDFIVLGGDILDGETNTDRIYSITEEFFSAAKSNNIPIAILSGNHDDNSYGSQGKTKAWQRNYYVDRSTVNAVFPDRDSCYYYFDIDKKGYRVICLDSCDHPQDASNRNWWCLSQKQMQWFCEIITETDHDIAIMTHMSPDYNRNFWGQGDEQGYHTDLINTIIAFNNKSSITLYGTTYNFSNVNGKIKWIHCGHSHIEFMEDYQVAGIPCVNTGCGKQAGQNISDNEQLDPSGDGMTYILTEDAASEFHANTYGYKYRHFAPRVIGTITECLFDIVSANSNNIYTFRVGIGKDRIFPYVAHN